MKGNSIIVTAQPKGVFLEGTIDDTSLPGTLMQIDPDIADTGGECGWEALAPSGGDGKPALIAVLLEDNLQGKGVSDAYVAGTRCFLYCPLPGEDMNVRVGEGGGTSNTLTKGDLLMADAENGILVPNSSGTSVPFQAREAETLGADNILIWCKATGH